MKTTQKSMNDNMLKVILLVALFATTQVPTLFAQEAATPSPEVTFVYSSGAQMEIGDSVMIHQDSLRYLTGERMSSWVYGVPHQIRQLGTKTKPAGVLLRGIYSWISQGSLMPLNVEKTQETIDRKRAEAEAAAAAAAAEAAAKAMMQEEYVEETTDSVVVIEEVVEEPQPVAPQPFKMNSFTIGIRGGLTSLMPQSDRALGAAWGYGVSLDLRYAHYWSKGDDKVRLGLMTGLGVGYMQNSQKLRDVLEESTLYSEGPIEYKVTADEAKELNHQLQLEIPLMFSMVTPKGFFLNVGPKVILPVYTPYTQTLTNTNIDAHLVTEGVDIHNEIVTGKLDAKHVTKGMNKHQYSLNVTVGGEIGYEHHLQSGHSISVGLYANYGVYNSYKHVADGDMSNHLVQIVPPTADGVAQVTTTSMNNAYVNKLGYLDAGLTVAFHLNWKK